MKHVTLCLVVGKGKILLGMKKQGFGKGKYNGFGGKVKRIETIEQAAVRELAEEAGIQAQKIRKVCELAFVFPHVPKIKRWDQIVHVFLVEKWKGKPIESKEMKPKWFAFDEIPYGRMWEDDRHWLPLVLKGKKIRAMFVFGEDDNSIKSMEIKLVEKLF
ncbi:MAG: 8-oxo-dGTP diphosphatase [Candidatus Aenigmarchaeota archaeon]|nr:8-oxo-dGTP diphosphatase [Candidatus Aenigmarchaeota archaeon]